MEVKRAGQSVSFIASLLPPAVYHCHCHVWRTSVLKLLAKRLGSFRRE